MRSRKHILIIVALIGYSFKVFGTAQIPDKLIFNGDTISIFSNPLEQIPTIDRLRPKLFGSRQGCSSTACWRGYQAEWEIANDELYLIGIYSCCFYEDSIQADLIQLFGNQYKNGRVKANWVTANILSPQGKQLYYVHMDYASLYEKEVIFEVVNGQLKGKITYDNTKSKKSIYSQDTTLLRFIYSNIEWEKLPKQVKPVRVYVQFSANELGIVDSVKLMKGFDKPFDNEALRVVKSTPEWDVFYRRGQHERRTWNLPIVFSEENKRKFKKN